MSFLKENKYFVIQNENVINAVLNEPILMLWQDLNLTVNDTKGKNVFGRE